MAFFHARTALYALLALVTITVFTGQHMVPPMDRDESRFAQASRQMLQSGDYVTIRFQDELRAKSQRAFIGCSQHLQCCLVMLILRPIGL